MPDVSFSALEERFSQTPAPDAVNEMLGKDLCEWLQAHIRESGIEFDFMGEVLAEDDGYGFWLNIAEVPYWITGTQLYPADPPDELLPMWLITVDSRVGCIWVFRPPPEPTHLGAIVSIIHEALAGDDAVSEIEWWRRNYGKGTPLKNPPLQAKPEESTG